MQYVLNQTDNIIHYLHKMNINNYCTKSNFDNNVIVSSLLVRDKHVENFISVLSKFNIGILQITCVTNIKQIY